MSAEDYKDDKGSKAKKLQTEIEAGAKDFVDAAERILVKIKPAADAAEEITLKDHPLKNIFCLPNQCLTVSTIPMKPLISSLQMVSITRLKVRKYMMK
jgi:hypothetical protein